MIPICKEKGCQLHGPGTPERAKCSRACKLDTPPGMKHLKKHKTPPRPKREAGVPCKHLSKGVKITPRTIPPWRNRPAGPEPWERVACGGIVSVEVIAASPEEVTCAACLRTFPKVQEEPSAS